MTKARIEVRQYISTIHMIFDDEGNLIGEEDQNDADWYDTVGIRPLTEDERAKWGLST